MSKTEGPSSRTAPDTPQSQVDLSACLSPFFRGRGGTSREGAASGGAGDGAGGGKVFEPSSVAWPAEGQEETEAGLEPTQAEAREGEDAWKESVRTWEDQCQKRWWWEEVKKR